MANTDSTSKKTIAVTGATGTQGGGVVRAILEDSERMFSVRAITRNPGSDAAAMLAELGAQVVRADLDDVDSLRRAFSGVHGAFCVTNFFEHFSPRQETAQAKNLAQAAQSEHVGHVIWSTLEDTRRWMSLDDPRMPTLMDSYKVPHFDAKGEADDTFRASGVPTTFLLTCFYWENLINNGMGPQKSADGELAIAFPMADQKLPGIAAADIGRCALSILKAGREFIGKTVGIAGEHLTGDEMAAELSKALGTPVRFNDVPPDVYRGFGFPGAEDIGNMFQFKRDFNADFCGVRDVDKTRMLNPSLLSFADWLEDNASKIPL